MLVELFWEALGFSFSPPASGPVDIEEVALHGTEFFEGVFEGWIGGVGVDVTCVRESWGAEGRCWRGWWWLIDL